MSNTTTELEKEFELERMVLFSDAVFAIAITLLIIEIKFPEIHKGATNEEILTLFKPTIIGFLAFMLSFFFVGVLWSRHLELFKYIRTYNSGVIFYNLLFLFFVVCFPFSASGLEHLRPSFILPMLIYMINIALVFVSQYALSDYVFRRKINLTKTGFDVEKKYFLIRSKYMAVILALTVCIVLTLSFLFPDKKFYSIMGMYSLPVMVLIMRKKLKKYKPVPHPQPFSTGGEGLGMRENRN